MSCWRLGEIGDTWMLGQAKSMISSPEGCLINLGVRCWRWTSLVAQRLRTHLPSSRLGRHRFSRWMGKIPWRREWQPTLVFLPGKSHGQRSLASYSLWCHTESDTTEHEMCFSIFAKSRKTLFPHPHTSKCLQDGGVRERIAFLVAIRWHLPCVVFQSDSWPGSRQSEFRPSVTHLSLHFKASKWNSLGRVMILPWGGDRGWGVVSVLSSQIWGWHLFK